MNIKQQYKNHYSMSCRAATEFWRFSIERTELVCSGWCGYCDGVFWVIFSDNPPSLYMSMELSADPISFQEKRKSSTNSVTYQESGVSG